MFVVELALAALLMTKETTPKPPVPQIRTEGVVFGKELVETIKSDLESLTGPGSVDISVDHETLLSVRVAVANFSPEVCNPVYDQELKLYRYFPDLNFDFYLRIKQAGRDRH